jgi:hypothetical protein
MQPLRTPHEQFLVYCAQGLFIKPERAGFGFRKPVAAQRSVSNSLGQRLAAPRSRSFFSQAKVNARNAP